ncbi:MAG: flagellin [Opitutae bacterium]|jgi:flagellin|nr:flagellin [Opitutae bacterium]MBT5910850.1 flagellin [Opitutae bacterium]
MALTINTNHAASTASYYLSKNNAALQKSLTRLSSGSRINKPADDAGGLAVSMKLSASINRLQGVNNNIQNAVSFLEVQDGVMEGAASILSRMGELKALSQDVLKNSSDIANYNAEFKNLQVQLYQMSEETFNGVSLFATTTTPTGATSTIFGGTQLQDNTVSIFTTERGGGGPKVSIGKASMLSAVTFDANNVGKETDSVAWATTGLTGSLQANGTYDADFSLASQTSANAKDLADVGTSFFTQALENIATLRAENGGSTSRLNFALEHVSRSQANLEAANGRIVDTDLAAESTQLAKYNILVQASASMLAQANVSPQTALMLLG